jgi:hypothetical protein
MANTFKTRADGDILRLMLESFHNKMKFLKTVNRQHDKDFGQAGRKNAGSIIIKNPNEYTVGTTEVVSVQNTTETVQTFTVASRANVTAAITSYERTMSEDDFKQEVADPAMGKLVATIESNCMKGLFPYVYSQTGTPATTPATIGAVLNARARLIDNCAPEDNNMFLMLNPTAMAAVVGGASAAYFHAASELEKGFLEGYYGRGAGFNWIESSMVPSHTNGTRTDTTPVATIGGTTSVPTGGIVNGSNVITMTAFADGTTYTVGDKFTIADVYAVNPETKETYDYLQQFVVLTAETETGSGDMSPAVSPTPQASGASQNISIASTGAKLIINLTAGGSGAASATHRLTTAYHRDAFSVAFASLPQPHGDVSKNMVIEGVPMRMWQFSDGINDTHTTRFDVVYGYLCQRPAWATICRG